MRIAIISDIHANITALEAVLDDVKQQQVEAVYCLGDLVGYAAFPNEVIDRIQRDGTPTIVGNYDDGVGFDGRQERELLRPDLGHVGLSFGDFIRRERLQRGRHECAGRRQRRRAS